jgi:hypothetical protein
MLGINNMFTANVLGGTMQLYAADPCIRNDRVG